MSRREELYTAIEQNGEVASSSHLLGVAGITDRSELHNLLYSLKKRGKITFRERHAKGKDSVVSIHVTKMKEHDVETVAEETVAQEAVEATEPQVLAADTAEPTNGTKVRTTDAIIEWLGRQVVDNKGWVMITTGELAGHISIEPGYVSAHLNNLEKQERIEVLRVQTGEGKRQRIIGVRTAAAKNKERAEKIKTFKDALWTELPHTPLVDQYEQAKQLATNSQWLSFEPEPIYEEALKLKIQLIHCINDTQEPKSSE